MGKVNMERSSNTRRNVFPGIESFHQITKGINEELGTNYIKEENQEENMVLRDNIEIRRIIESLNKRDNKNNGKIQT